MHDVQRFHLKADRIFRAQGNHSGRQRMREVERRNDKPNAIRAQHREVAGFISHQRVASPIIIPIGSNGSRKIGATADFTVVLNSRPTANVTISITSGDTGTAGGFARSRVPLPDWHDGDGQSTNPVPGEKVYLYPVETEWVEKVIQKEKPDAIIAGFGGRIIGDRGAHACGDVAVRLAPRRPQRPWPSRHCRHRLPTHRAKRPQCSRGPGSASRVH